MFFHGFSATSNDVDFRLSRGGNYGIYGGRFENGKRFLDTMTGGNFPNCVGISDVLLTAYAPSDNIIFRLGSGGTLAIRNPHISKASGLYTAAMITSDSGAGAYGSVIVDGGFIQAANPCFTMGAGTWQINFRHVTRGSGADAVTAAGFFT